MLIYEIASCIFKPDLDSKLICLFPEGNRSLHIVLQNCGEEEECMSYKFDISFSISAQVLPYYPQSEM
jgi:hypothetical protein